MNETAAQWFTNQAAASPQYAAAVTDRGHQPAQAQQLGVGYAPARPWNGLVAHLRANGYRPWEIVAAGLGRTAANGHTYDMFRDRIMFPITNHRGRVAGFTARDATGHPDTPKYLNTPTTTVYDKGRLLYGTAHINNQTAGLVLVEGPWDALAVTTATGERIVGLAACGTAVTGEHLRLVANLGRPVCLCMDADPAGLHALGRLTHQIHSNGGPHPKAIALPTGTDLADLHQTGGPQAVTTALAAALPAGVVYADLHLQLNPPGDWAEARVAAARAASTHAAGLTPDQLAILGGHLVARAGLATQAVLPIITEHISQTTVNDDNQRSQLPPRRPSLRTTGTDPPAVANLLHVTCPYPPGPGRAATTPQTTMPSRQCTTAGLAMEL